MPGWQEGRGGQDWEIPLATQFTSPVSCLFVCLLKGKSDFYTKEEWSIYWCERESKDVLEDCLGHECYKTYGIQECWRISVTPALHSQARQEEDHELEASLGYLERDCLKRINE